MRDPRVKMHFEYYSYEKQDVVAEDRHFLLDLNAIEAFEEVTGINLMEANNLKGDMGIKELKALLFAGLSQEDPELTAKQVGSMIHAGNMMQLVAEITEAMQMSLPEKTGEKAEGAKASGPFDGTSLKQ